MSAAQSDNGRHHRVAAKDLQANEKVNHRHSGACHGYPLRTGRTGQSRDRDNLPIGIVVSVVVNLCDARAVRKQPFQDRVNTFKRGFWFTTLPKNLDGDDGSRVRQAINDPLSVTGFRVFEKLLQLVKFFIAEFRSASIDVKLSVQFTIEM